MVLGGKTIPTAETITATTDTAEAPQEPVMAAPVQPGVVESDSSEEDDTLSYFKQLAEDK